MSLRYAENGFRYTDTRVLLNGYTCILQITALSRSPYTLIQAHSGPTIIRDKYKANKKKRIIPNNTPCVV